MEEAHILKYYVMVITFFDRRLHGFRKPSWNIKHLFSCRCNPLGNQWFLHVVLAMVAKRSNILLLLCLYYFYSKGKMTAVVFWQQQSD